MNFHHRDDSSNSSDGSSSGSSSSESGSSVSSMQTNHTLERTGGQGYSWMQWGANVQSTVQRQLSTVLGNQGIAMPGWLSAGQAVQDRNHAAAMEARQRNIESLMQELFRKHDLNKNGVLEEIELIKLNEKIAMLHYGKDTDRIAVKAKYQNLFRTKLDPAGRPVPYTRFREYMIGVLHDFDPDPAGQEMMLEQFIAEATTARAAFHIPSMSSFSDQQFRPTISFDESNTFARSSEQPNAQNMIAIPEEEMSQPSFDAGRLSAQSQQMNNGYSPNYQQWNSHMAGTHLPNGHQSSGNHVNSNVHGVNTSLRVPPMTQRRAPEPPPDEPFPFRDGWSSQRDGHGHSYYAPNY